MNARQTKKRLKLQISKLQSDNNLMRDIIADNPAMQELYDLYNKPLNVTHSTLLPKHYKISQMIDAKELVYLQDRPQLLKTHIENRILQGLRPLIWDNLKTEKDRYMNKYSYSLDIWVGVESQKSEDKE